ncbi:hypothetical protein AB4Z32_26750 [Massilia sp. 2TAF26]|uniref:hypothetical protein n=1 Tax=Massilia sp. 2TAF26 TaxID=3233012 RepID=UPI003F9C21AD
MWQTLLLVQSRHGIERSCALRVLASAFDKPNTALTLKEEGQARLRHLGVERGGLFCIFLYIDNPKDLVRTLSLH